MKKTKLTRFEIARELSGGEIPDWKFDKQLQNLNMIIEDMHQSRPLMSVKHILEVVLGIE